ncbi:MAG: TlpA disulfide reductase family protein [Verrucomicrobiota bacterium]
MSVPTTVKNLGVMAEAKSWAFDQMKGKGAPEGEASQIHSLIGQPAPEIELAMLDGSPFKLSESLGREVVVLDFWATWCGPCVRALPEVMAAVEGFEGKKVRLVALNQQEAAAKVTGFLKSKKWNLPVVLDESGAARDAYQVKGIPTTVIIGMDGKVTMVHSGFSPGLKEALTADIHKALD